MAQVNPMRPMPVATPGQQQMIRWAPIAAPQELTFTGTSYADTRRALVAAFGEFPIRLDGQHLVALTAMAAVAGPDVRVYDLIRRALEKHGNLELTDH